MIIAYIPDNPKHDEPHEAAVGGKLNARLTRLNRRTVGLRRNAQHQMTATLIHKFKNIVVEDLNVAGMMQGKTPKAQADAGMGEMKRQIIYKGHWRHTNVSLAHRFLPIQQDLLQLPDRERETQAGTGLAVQQLWQHPRKKPQRSRQPA